MNNFENSININKLIAELDHILSKNDYNSARDFLEKWVDIAQNQNDNKSLFSLPMNVLVFTEKSEIKKTAINIAKRLLIY